MIVDAGRDQQVVVNVQQNQEDAEQQRRLDEVRPAPERHWSDRNLRLF